MTEQEREKQIVHYSDEVMRIADLGEDLLLAEVRKLIDRPELQLLILGRIHLLMHRRFFNLAVSAGEEVQVEREAAPEV